MLAQFAAYHEGCQVVLQGEVSCGCHLGSSLFRDEGGEVL